MALTGDFRETRFADLVRLYGISGRSAAISIRLDGAAGDPDGIFWFEGGDLVAARLAGAEGREALQRALRLRRGTFTVALDAVPPPGTPRAAFNQVLLEELVRVREEERAASAAGSAAPAAERRATGRMHLSVALRVALAVCAAALAIGGTVLLLLSRPAKRMDAAVDRLLGPPPPVRGVADAEIVFGMAAPFSGANRELGRGMKDGIETAFAAVNARGGVHGRKLRLVALDDGYEPSRTAAVMRQLVEGEGAFAVVGNVGTPTAAVAIPYCLEKKVVFLGALSGGDLLRRSPPDRYVFNFRPSYAEETAAAVRWLVHARRIAPARVAVFAQEDEFGESGWRGVARQLAEEGADPSRTLRVGYRRNTSDVEAAVATLRRRARSVDAVVMVATYEAAAAFVRKARDAGLAFPVTDVSAVDSNALADELVGAGARYAKDVVVTQVVPSPASRTPAAAAYHAALARHGPGARPGFLGLEGWIVGNVLAEGLRRAGRDVDGEKLVAALEGMHALDVGIGAAIGFGPREHQASHRVWGTALQPDGSWRQVDLE